MESEPSHPKRKLTDNEIIAKLRSQPLSRTCREAADRLEELTGRQSTQSPRDGTR